mmetsp:Transcript_1601/g.2254  ORF Transcript_1601/g.2254 Transcript_1601/m.2254 type:complete len:215 (-) Transcript_1601:3-647(-)
MPLPFKLRLMATTRLRFGAMVGLRRYSNEFSFIGTSASTATTTASVLDNLASHFPSSDAGTNSRFDGILSPMRPFTLSSSPSGKIIHVWYPESAASLAVKTDIKPAPTTPTVEELDGGTIAIESALVAVRSGIVVVTKFGDEVNAVAHFKRREPINKAFIVFSKYKLLLPLNELYRMGTYESKSKTVVDLQALEILDMYVNKTREVVVTVFLKH